MPGSTDVGANIAELNASKTKRPRKQKVAIALSQARKAGNKKIKAPPFGKGQDRPVPGKPGMVMEPKSEAKEEHSAEEKETKVGVGQGRYNKAKYQVGRGQATPATTTPPAAVGIPRISPNLAGMRQPPSRSR